MISCSWGENETRKSIKKQQIIRIIGVRGFGAKIEIPAMAEVRKNQNCYACITILLYLRYRLK
jgi:hypothetical protein